jgi:anti-sigma regulatory factor (Ser/Thr protein kinase)
MLVMTNRLGLVGGMMLLPAICTSGTTRAFAAELAQVRLIRAFVSERGQGCPFLADLLLAASELAANAIRHSAPAPDGTISVTVICDAGMAWLAVTDGGQGASTPHLHAAQEGDEGGRGLQLIDALAWRWGFTRVRDASTTWCEFGEVIR